MAPEKKISRAELEQWPGVGHVHKELGLSRQGIRNMLESGRLRGIKTRIGWLIDPVSVRAILLLQRDDAEREKKAERDALVARAESGGSRP